MRQRDTVTVLMVNDFPASVYDSPEDCLEWMKEIPELVIVSSDLENLRGVIPGTNGRRAMFYRAYVFRIKRRKILVSDT